MDGIVTHFEIPADNVRRARKFYSKLFDWELSPFYGSEYLYITPKNGSRVTTQDRVSGGLDKRGGSLEHVTVVFEVESVDKSLRTAEKLGGRVVRKKQPVGDFGCAGYFSDTEGNVLGVFEQIRHSKRE